MFGKITSTYDRSKSETMNYVLILNSDYSELFEGDKSLSERLTRDQFNEFSVLDRRNGTKLFHAVCGGDEDRIDRVFNKILDTCIRDEIKAICLPEPSESNDPEFYETLHENFCTKGIDVTVLFRRINGANTDTVHSLNLRRAREQARIRHRRTPSIVGFPARRRLNFDTIMEQEAEE